MRVRRPSSARSPGVRRAGRPWARWAATLALVSVLFQALASGAMAHTVTGEGVAQVICTAQGAVQGVSTSAADTPLDNARAQSAAKPAEGKAKTVAGLPCQDCLIAATAAVVPPDPEAVMVRYARKAQVWRAVAATVRKHARAPPRPPSRAPPIV